MVIDQDESDPELDDNDSDADAESLDGVASVGPCRMSEHEASEVLAAISRCASPASQEHPRSRVASPTAEEADDEDMSDAMSPHHALPNAAIHNPPPVMAKLFSPVAAVPALVLKASSNSTVVSAPVVAADRPSAVTTSVASTPCVFSTTATPATLVAGAKACSEPIKAEMAVAVSGAEVVIASVVSDRYTMDIASIPTRAIRVLSPPALSGSAPPILAQIANSDCTPAFSVRVPDVSCGSRYVVTKSGQHAAMAIARAVPAKVVTSRARVVSRRPVST